MKRSITTVLSAMLMSASLCANLANAADSRVDASDLDLRNPADAEILYERITRAAGRVCRSDKASWDAKVQKNYNRCKKIVIDDAVARFNQPLLTAVHEGTVEKVATN